MIGVTLAPSIQIIFFGTRNNNYYRHCLLVRVQQLPFNRRSFEMTFFSPSEIGCTIIILINRNAVLYDLRVTILVSCLDNRFTIVGIIYTSYYILGGTKFRRRRICVAQIGDVQRSTLFTFKILYCPRKTVGRKPNDRAVHIVASSIQLETH